MRSSCKGYYFGMLLHCTLLQYKYDCIGSYLTNLLASTATLVVMLKGGREAEVRSELSVIMTPNVTQLIYECPLIHNI